MRRSVVAVALSGLSLVFFTSTNASAQSTYGAIHGIVREGSGEPVAGATVTVTSVEKGTQFKQKTNKYGHYEFPQLLPESYDLTAEAAGRKTTTQDISVVADGEALVNPVLPRRGQPAAVTGAAGGSTLNTRADVSITLDRTAIQSLPNFRQNADVFHLLAPGAQLNLSGGNSSQNPGQNIPVSFNGNLANGTALLLDGTANPTPVTIINPALESLAEIKITTQSYDAETGQALSGVVASETRSGSNAWHGSLLDFRRTNWGEASNPNLQNPSLAVISPFRIDLFGGSVGGPIVKNKLFVFGDYQGTRRSFSSTPVLNVPSQQVRDTCLNATSAYCDLSQYGAILYDPQMPAGTLFAPIPGCAGGQAAGYCIPQSRISPQAVNLLSLLPPPNLPGVVSNYSVTGSEGYDEDYFTVRVDDNLSQKFHLLARYSFADYRIDAPSAFGALVGGVGFAPDGFAGQSRSRDHNLSAGFDYSLSAGLFTDFRFGFYRINLHTLENDYNTTPATNAGLPGLNLGDALTSGMPAIQIIQPAVSNNISFGDGAAVNGCDCPNSTQIRQFQWVNNWAKTQGNHLFRWGVDFRYGQDASMRSLSRRSGMLAFSGRLTSNMADNGTGLGLATFLLGYVTKFSRTAGTISDSEDRQKRTFFYGQDTWRVTPRLTLNYGLRWEIYFPQYVDGKNKGGYLDLNTGTLDIAGYPCCNLGGNIRNTLTNFAPRVGMAYQVNSRTILRAAYGRNFDAASGQVFSTAAAQNPPVELVQNPQATNPTKNKQHYVFQFGDAAQCALNPSRCVPPPPNILYPNVPPNGQIPPLGLVGVTLNAVPSKLRVPTLDQWNLTVQRELTSNMYVEVGYVGNKGTHLALAGTGFYNLNQPTIAGYLKYCFNDGPTSSGCLARYPFYSNFGWTQPIDYTGDDASSNYNSLQAKLVKRFTKGYEFQANYTWAKGLGYDTNYYNQNPGLDYAVNDFDRKHTFVFYNVLNLPVGRGKALLGDIGSAANYLVGGWSINTSTIWASGLPFSLSYNPNECSVDRDTGPCRPNIVGDVRITGDRNNYFTTTGGLALAAGSTGPGATIGPWQRPEIGTFGTAGRNSLRGPSYYDTDVAVTKDVAISERYLVQFRTDFLNVFNRVNLGNPSGCVDCFSSPGQATGGVITTLAANASQRQVEFSLRVQF